VTSERRVVVGQISGLFGVKGWVKVFSFTEPRENIFHYQPWFLCPKNQSDDCVVEYQVAESRVHGKGLIVLLDGIDEPDSVARLIGAEILVGREQFEGAEKGEYYWADLIGLHVSTVDERALGVVQRLTATGANDVLVVEGDRRRLIPFLVDTVIRRVDLEHGQIIVDWDPDF